METLLDILTQYAEENLLTRLLREHTPKMQASQLLADHLTQEMKALNPELEQSIEKLEIELNNINFFREQAFLLSGISIGLELGRL